MLSFEGNLTGKIIKYHSRIIDRRDEGSMMTNRFIQVGITDITESVILKKLLYGTSEALKRAAKAADEDTGEHVARINRYAGLLASLNECEKKFVEDISQFAQLHDIGKINVAEIIRLPRKLTDEEFNSMKKHTLYGGEMVAGLDGLEMAFNIALEHHEKWDGSGYPEGKKKDEVSLEARIVAIADVFVEKGVQQTRDPLAGELDRCGRAGAGCDQAGNQSQRRDEAAESIAESETRDNPTARCR